MKSRTPARTVTLLALILLIPGTPAVGAQSDQRPRLPRPLRSMAERPPTPQAAVNRIMRDAMLNLTAAVRGEDTRAASDEDEDEWAFGDLLLLPAGDLNGDGVPDGVENSYVERETATDWSFETSASAVDGSTGEDLWSLGLLDDGYLIPAGDLDGDGLDDVLHFGYEDLPLPGYFWTITVGARRGLDGSELWTREYLGSYNWVETSLGLWIDHFDVTFPWDLADDATGDGRTDVMMVRFQGTFAYSSLIGYGTWDESTTVEILSGGDGGATVSAISPPGWAEPEIVEDMSGDGLQDVAVTGWDGEPYASAYTGLGGVQLWSRSTDDWGWVVGSGDLDGDGRADLLYIEETFDWDDDEEDEGIWSDVLRILSGADGADLWSRDIGWFDWPTVAGDADGDGGSEILLTGRSGSKRTLRLLRGKDGKSLWSRSQSGGSFVRTGDLNGDGVRDAVALRKVKVKKKKKKVDVASAVSGRTGKTLWSRKGIRRVTSIGGDANGDGRDDVARVDGRRYRVLRGTSGKNLWSGAITATGSSSWLLVASAPGGGESLLFEAEAWGLSPVQTAARSARTGELRWIRTLDF